jgi:hypothetical protein
MHPVVAWCLAAGLVVLDWLPLLTLASPSRLHAMSPARASALLARWSRSRVRALRLLIQGARGLVMSVYFDQSEVHAAMHYDPVPFMRDRVRRRDELLLGRSLAAR